MIIQSIDTVKSEHQLHQFSRFVFHFKHLLDDRDTYYRKIGKNSEIFKSFRIFFNFKISNKQWSVQSCVCDVGLLCTIDENPLE